MKPIHRRLINAGACLTVLLAVCTSAGAAPLFRQTNLVSDIPGLAAFTDPNLRNPWGISSSPTSPFWVSNQVTGTATLYNTAGQPQGLIVTIPGGNPTGQVFNTTSSFGLPTGGNARFLFATLNGTIAAWNGGTTAQIAASTPGAVYTGLALGSSGSGDFLYAANSEQNRIDVFNGSFALTSLSADFTDPTLPSGFSVYNAQQIGDELVVTYENEASGGGIVNAFDLSGNFLHRLSGNGAGGPLESPWGLAIAPASFGPLAGALLVGNEGDGHISAFDFTSGAFLGQLLGLDSNPLANTGLWGLRVGNGGNGGDPSKLYFAAGINGEVDGLFGSISLAEVPEPGTLLLVCIGVVALVTGSRPVHRSQAANPR